VEVKRRRKPLRSVEREDLRGEEQVRVVVIRANVEPVDARRSAPSVSLNVGLREEQRN